MSTFLDDVARSLARPMPRKRALRVLGGAITSVVMPGLVSRSARAAANVVADPCSCSPGPPAAQCGLRYGAGCTKVCCVQGSILPKCCNWGIDRALPNSSSYSCINKPYNGPGFPAHTICCCPANTYCGDIAIGEPPCITCTAAGRQPCGQNCCKPGEHCASASISLCCKQGEIRCGSTCCRQGSCADPKLSLCCRPGQIRCGKKCCHASQVCSGGRCRCAQGWLPCGNELCCDKRTERCAPVGGRRTTPYCCPRYQWNTATSTCCPRYTYPSGSGCCSLGQANKNCCVGVTCLAGTTCVNGFCRQLR